MGVLYVCSTPIGNLEDASPRAVRILKEADLIAAEDTRQTKKILGHFGIRTNMTSYHKFNIKEKTKFLIGQILGGKSIALVTDAGMPGISDPGEELVKSAIENNIPIIPIPGPSAAITALAVSGLKTGRFVFEGFFPREGKARRRILRGLREERRTLIIYESPHRFLKTLKDILDILGNRRICVARELTKKFEEIFRGSAEEAIKKFSQSQVLGEITMVIEGNF